MHTTRTTIRTLALAAATALFAAAGAAHASPKEPAAAQAADDDGVVNLNSATQDELALLPGVGPSKAGAILAWRTQHGSFKKVDDLTHVRGFGHKTLQRLRSHLAVSGATTFHGKQTRGGHGKGTASATP